MNPNLVREVTLGSVDGGFWQTIITEPLYNLLIWLVNMVPNHSVALAIIVMTLLVKLALSPLHYKSLMNQRKQQLLQPYVKKIQAKYKDDKQKLTQATMEFYKKNKTNPFSGCLLILLQLPVIWILYRIFLQGVVEVPYLLYKNNIFPDQIKTTFLGFDVADTKVWGLAIAAGLTQLLYVQLAQSFKKPPTTDTADIVELDGKAAMQQEMMKSMQKSMKFTMPILIAVFAFITPAAVGLYWVTSNLFLVVQELFVSRKVKKNPIVIHNEIS